METVIVGILNAAIISGTVIAIAGLGELLSEQAGVFNLGLEGIMMMGAVTAIIIVNGYNGNVLMGLIAAVIVGSLLGIVFAIATVFFQADQVLCGLAMSFLGSGLAGRIGMTYSGQPAISRLLKLPIPILSDIPVIGKAIFSQNILVYFGLIILPLIVWFILYRTRHGLEIRSIGENPAAADASGIPIYHLRFLYACLGAALAALAGSYITLGYTPSWSSGVTGGRGWIAIALVIFAGWRPFRVILGALLFGGITSLGFLIQVLGWGIPAAFLSMMPYISAIVLIAFPFIFNKKGRKLLSLSPDALGFPYYRE